MEIRNKKNKGFTLMELLVVIAIISLLSSIVFASVSSARDKANISKAQVQAKEIQKAIELGRLSSESLPVNIEPVPIKLATNGAVKMLIEEVISVLPEPPDSVSDNTSNKDYYYISDGAIAEDEDGWKYSCGYDNARAGIADDYVLFYKDKVSRGAYNNELWNSSSELDNTLFFFRIGLNETAPSTCELSGMWDTLNTVCHLGIYGSDPNSLFVYTSSWYDTDNTRHGFRCIK